jgi:hypothetical protein
VDARDVPAAIKSFLSRGWRNILKTNRSRCFFMLELLREVENKHSITR